MLTESTQRVTKHTASKVNEKIRQKTVWNISRYQNASPEEIGKRLVELDKEWDIERFLQIMPAGLVLIGIVLGFFFSKYWLIIPAFVSAFLINHAIQGWCPPVPVLRRFGVRTIYEIEKERYALKLIRGDFKDVDMGLEGVTRAVDLK
jgi:hypothetical protein